MKYSTTNLNEPGITLPLSFPMKLIIEYRPGGVLADFAPIMYSSDPERAADEIVKERGWDRLQNFQPTDVWIDGAF